MTYSDAINQLLDAAEIHWGSLFAIDGDPKQYVGTFDQRTRRPELTMGGFTEDVDATLEVRKAQFTAAPKHGRRVTVEGHRYIINAIDEDSHTYTFRLSSTNR